MAGITDQAETSGAGHETEACPALTGR
jgi:hypothetical protein